MPLSDNNLQNSMPGGEEPAPNAGANPAGLTVAQAAQVLAVPEATVRRHLAQGLPAAPGEKINLLVYVAWLNQRLRDTDGD